MILAVAWNRLLNLKHDRAAFVLAFVLPVVFFSVFASIFGGARTATRRVPLIVVGCRKIGEPMNYELILEDCILHEDYQDRPDAVTAMTQRFTSALERIVTTAPEQYFWLHRRWKHQPARRHKKAA